MPDFYEFFAGGGMVRAGLGSGWTCLFANDFDAKKAAAYRANWGEGGELHLGDVRRLQAPDLPGRPDLVWGSFPCQDLSLAGAGAGLNGDRSGTFYPFWDLVRGLAAEGRAPSMVAVENVCGALTSRGGSDFEAICRTFVDAGYRPGAMVINAELFLPQSRPRLFVVGVRSDIELDTALVACGPEAPFHSRSLIKAAGALAPELRDRLVWWRVPTPAARNHALADLIEEAPNGVAWHGAAVTARLLDLMGPVHRAKLDAAQGEARLNGRRQVGCVYRRTRTDGSGVKRQRAEVRFDDLAGCLRTPGGGSSRQTILVVEPHRVRSRLISARETARLMGLPDDYVLPAAYNEAYHLTGDGVAVPVVRHLARCLFEPLIPKAAPDRKAA